MQPENGAKRCTCLISTDLPRDSKVPLVRPGQSPGHIYGNFCTEQPHAPQTQPINHHEKRDRESRTAWKMVYLLSLCSLFWLLLFTSNSDAVHPSAVYRSFHQNDHFTVPLRKSTLSAQCKAAYDKLRNPNSSDVTELVACKFVRSACFFLDFRGKVGFPFICAIGCLHFAILYYSTNFCRRVQNETPPRGDG